MTPSVTTRPSETTFYRTDEIDLKSMMVSLLDYVAIIKEEYWGRYGDNLTLTYPGDGSCSMLGIGFALDSVAASQVWGSPLTQVPLLTNVIRISKDRFYIPSENTSVLLNEQQFLSVCKKLGILMKLRDNGPPQISIFKDAKTGDLLLENFDITKLNVCRMSYLGLNLMHELENTLQLLQEHWDKLTQVVYFYGSENLLQQLATCLNSKNMTVEVFLNTPTSSFRFCVNNLVDNNETLDKDKRSANILSFLLGDGKQLNAIEDSLQASIEHYNDNFKKLKIFDDQIIQNFKNLDTDVNNLAKIELNLQDKLAELTRFSKLMDIKYNYLLIKLQHSTTLHRLLTESKLLDNLKLLERALFSGNECSLAVCEVTISAEGLGTKVLVHREVLELRPIKKFLVTCQAPSITLVPRIHNKLAEKTESGNFLIQTKLYTEENLRNATLVNDKVRVLASSEKLMGKFHHFSESGMNVIQCLGDMTFSLNGKKLQCLALQTFRLPEKFTLMANGETLRSQKLVESRQRVEVDWLQDFEFSNIDSLPMEPEPSLTVLHPELEKFFYTPAGELNTGHVSYVGIGTGLVLLSFFGCCCWKVESFRTFMFAKVRTVYEFLYKVFTTSEFRLKRERNKLDSKIEKGYAELKKVEGLVDKKLELNKKVPRHGNNEPSAPNMEDSITKVSGAVRAEVDVHAVKDVRYVPRPIHNHKCSSSSKRTSE